MMSVSSECLKLSVVRSHWWEREEVDGMPEEWAQLAREHLRAGDLLLKEGLYHLACFHAQRAAAHAMQALLEKNGVPVPHGATLLEMLSACTACDPEAASLRGACALLDLYLNGSGETALPVPGMLPWGPPSYEQAEATLEAGRRVVQTLGRMNSLFALTAVA
jgi:HEPN domain-containing protein